MHRRASKWTHICWFFHLSHKSILFISSLSYSLLLLLSGTKCKSSVFITCSLVSFWTWTKAFKRELLVTPNPSWAVHCTEGFKPHSASICNHSALQTTQKNVGRQIRMQSNAGTRTFSGAFFSPLFLTSIYLYSCICFTSLRPPKIFTAMEMAKQEALISLNVYEAGMRKRYLSLINRGCWRKWTDIVIHGLSKLILKHFNEG